jgi:hypothetical protein
MALAHGYALPFEALRRTGVLAQNTADATIRATADGATKEAAGSCLDARALEVQQRTVVQPSILVVPQLTRNGVVLNQLPDTRTNFIQNNTMVGATGSVRPNLWDLGTIPSGFTVSFSASGQTTAADGTLVDYIDVTVSGTALASGFLNLRQLPSPSPVSGNLLFASGMTYTASVYLALLSGSVSGISPTYQLQELANTTFVDGSNIGGLSALTSSLTRYSVTRTMTGASSADRVSVRWGHSIVSGTSYDYTVRIASPQLEKGSVATPLIRTASGFVTVDMLGVARDGAPPDFTFTRPTTATRVNASGLIESVASGVLRLDYPIGGGCPAALIEPAATNFARNVQFMTGQDTPAASGGMTITTGSTDFLAPDGTSGSITKYVGGAASGNTQYAYFSGGNITVTASGQHTFSLFVKAGTTNPLNFCAIGFTAYIGGSGTATSYFSLASGTALTAGASIQDYGNGWYRLISAPYTIASGDLAGNVLFYQAEGNNDITWPASGALNLTAYTWGAQVETGAIRTSYIPTTTASATRNADVCTVSGVSGYIGQTEGTIYAEVDVRNLAIETYIIRIDEGASSNNITLRKLNTNQIRTAIVAPTTSGTLNISSAAFTAGIIKIAFAYKSGEIALSVNGATPLTANGTFAFGAPLNRITLGSNQSSSSEFNDRIRSAALYTTRLDNTTLANITRLT